MAEYGNTNIKNKRISSAEGWIYKKWLLHRKEPILNSEDWGTYAIEPETSPMGNVPAKDLAWFGAYYMGGEFEKSIYLTFDCGYENGNTPLILDVLKKHNAKATFFVTGHFLKAAPDIVKRMVVEGHTVGNHTLSHETDITLIASEDFFRKEMKGVEELFYKITGKEISAYYRPPAGKCSAENLKLAREMGYNTFFWSLSYVDWDQDRQPSHEEAFENLVSWIHPGAIVLLHNTSQTSSEILDDLLSRWEEMGYRFQELSKVICGGLERVKNGIKQIRLQGMKWFRSMFRLVVVQKWRWSIEWIRWRLGIKIKWKFKRSVARIRYGFKWLKEIL